ncbi:MAG: hypothetical protein IKE69_12420 [Thermoguttaceae bacterium]|nr:hypothetical protein [Thermoguttaceae bacterium]
MGPDRLEIGVHSADQLVAGGKRHDIAQTGDKVDCQPLAVEIPRPVENMNLDLRLFDAERRVPPQIDRGGIKPPVDQRPRGVKSLFRQKRLDFGQIRRRKAERPPPVFAVGHYARDAVRAHQHGVNHADFAGG